MSRTPSKIFCLVVPKIAAEEPFSLSLTSGIVASCCWLCFSFFSILVDTFIFSAEFFLREIRVFW